MGKLSKDQKKDLIRIIISMVLFAALIVAGGNLEWCRENEGSRRMLLLWLVPYFIVGYDVVINCIRGIANGQMFDETFLMTLATVGAFGCNEYTEAVAVMLFYQVGEFFQTYAVGKSRNAIQELMSIAPEYANRELEDGSIEVIDPDDIKIGDVLVIKPGEKIPIDGVVIEGAGLVNTSALTGESMPQNVEEGDAVISGCINGETLLKIQADRLYDDSTVAQILDMVENAASKKSQTESFITRFARYYTPVVVIGAVLLAFLPPLISGSFAAEFGKWVLRACTFLVISCPCALVISVPLAFFGGIGAASKVGVLVKGSNYLEMMSQLDTLVTDKTGTLTEGKFRVTTVEAVDGYTTEEIIRLAAAVETGSTHPIASAICEACDNPVSERKVSDVENISGKGMIATVGRSKICVGNAALFEYEGIRIPEQSRQTGTVVYVAKGNKYIGRIEVADSPKPEAAQAISEMLAEKVNHIVMLTGDAEGTAKAVASELGITEYRAQLLPQDKVKAVEELLDGLKESRGRLAFVGDGINDAPVLTRADVGIAMGSLGSDAAIEAADIVIMDDRISKIPTVIRIARKTIGISKFNIAFALAVKIACLVLGALGIANMWAAVFADVGVAMICIINSMRMLRFE
ncbi:MAG: cadmium-translocating P-type ATPase [Clostridiales bacterium]|nr:cadmium-translocating P-type ATPase [Candidatus Crickella caballi]